MIIDLAEPPPVSVFVRRREPIRDFVASPHFANPAVPEDVSNGSMVVDSGVTRPVISRAARIPLNFFWHLHNWTRDAYVSGKVQQSPGAQVTGTAQLPWEERTNVRVPDITSRGAYYELDVRTPPLF